MPYHSIRLSVILVDCNVCKPQIKIAVARIKNIKLIMLHMNTTFNKQKHHEQGINHSQHILPTLSLCESVLLDLGLLSQRFTILTQAGPYPNCLNSINVTVRRNSVGIAELQDSKLIPCQAQLSSFNIPR